MDHVPTADEMRACVRPVDDLDRKVLGGLLALWMASPERVRDRERTARVVLLVLGAAAAWLGFFLVLRSRNASHT